MGKRIIILLAIAIMLMMVTTKGFSRSTVTVREKAVPTYYLLTGKVTSIDLKTGRIVITSQANISFQLVINEKTVITKAGKVIILSGIKKMDPVKVNYWIDQGERITGSVAVFGQRKKPATGSSAKRIK